MPVKYKSVANAIKRGHLRISTTIVPAPYKTDVITGAMTGGTQELPFIERKTNKGTWIPYKF